MSCAVLCGKMRKFVAIFLLASLGFVDGVVRYDCACGESNIANQGRIINGEEVSPNKYPWMAVMLSAYNNQVCSGSILTDRMILTAGHCMFYTPLPRRVRWMVSAHSVKMAKEVASNIYRTISYQFHPKFQSGKLFDNYDFCLVMVDRPIAFNRNTVPICLPQPFEDMNYFNEKVIVAGWGKLFDRNDSPVSDVLMETKLHLMTPGMCKAMTGLPGYNVHSMMCAFDFNTDACLGDSGGPLFIETKPNRYVILGVISFGEGCATQFPGVYAKVDEPETLFWLKNAMRGDICHDPPIRRFLNAISSPQLYND